MGAVDHKVQCLLTVPTVAKKRPLQTSRQNLGESKTPGEQHKERTFCFKERGCEAWQTGRSCRLQRHQAGAGMGLGRRTERPDARGGNLHCAAGASEGGPTQEASKKQPLGGGLPPGSCLLLQLPSHPARLSSGRRHAPHPGAPSPASASAAASPAASPAAFCGPG